MDWPRQIRGLLTCYRCILSTPPYDKDHLLIACLYNFLSRVLFEGKRSLFLSLHVWQSLAFSKNQQTALKTNHYSGTPQRKIKQDEDRSKSLCKALPALFSGLERQWHTQKVIWDDFSSEAGWTTWEIKGLIRLCWNPPSAHLPAFFCFFQESLYDARSLFPNVPDAFLIQARDWQTVCSERGRKFSAVGHSSCGSCVAPPLWCRRGCEQRMDNRNWLYGWVDLQKQS